MRIGVLTTSFPRYEGDVAGSFVLDLARALARRGHALTVLAPQARSGGTQTDWPAAPGHVQSRLVPYVWPRSLARTFYGAGVMDNARDPRSWPGLATFPPALALAAARELADCDALLSHFGLPCGLIGALVRRGRPHVVVLHSADVHLLQRLPQSRALARTLLRGADPVVCVSESARDCVLELSAGAAHEPSRVQVQAMGVDLDACRVTPPERASARAALGVRVPVLLSLSRLVPVKGLCEALSVLGQRTGFEWWIAGDGPERFALEQRARAARLPVKLLGEVRGERKRQVLAAADALLLPSCVLPSGRTEGAPLAVLEGLAAGLLVIGSDVGGVRELLCDGRAGLLFDPRVPAGLHAALDAWLLGTADRASLQAAGDEVALAHDVSTVAARFERWLERSSHAR